MRVDRLSDQAAFAGAMVDPHAPCPGALFAWNGSDPATRLAVHRNNFVSSLVDSLEETVPVVRELVGEHFFRAMAAEYVRASPPRSRVLSRYGDSLPDFIEGFPPAQSLPYLADMARLELARMRAYHAADAESLDPARLSQHFAVLSAVIEPQLELHPSFSALRSRYAVHSLWAAHHGKSELSQIDPYSPEDMFVVRRGNEVQIVRLGTGDYEFIKALQAGAGIADAAAEAQGTSEGFSFTTVLIQLLLHGALSAPPFLPSCAKHES